ncbi:MAG: hypothetical protein Q7U53_11970 [Anaerolineaceae bacterium]|nr:hypothetical protein [Anaerolineaceae bacterium]
MDVIRLHAPFYLQMHDESDPIAIFGEEVVDGRAVDICGSDNKKSMMRRNIEHCKDFY